MSESVTCPVFSRTDVRFCVLGWTASENDFHAAKFEEFRQYAGRAAAQGLTEAEISSDIFEASDGLFEGVDTSFVSRENKAPLVSVIALASGAGRDCIPPIDPICKAA